MDLWRFVYWQGQPVGLDCGPFIKWFPNATPEIKQALAAGYGGFFAGEASA